MFQNALQHDLAVGPIEEVSFVPLSATPYQYRDAVRFGNGREIRLRELRVGQRVRVLKVSLQDDSPFQAELEEPRGVFVAQYSRWEGNDMVP